MEPGVVETIGVPEVDVAVHHGLCRCHESRSKARTTDRRRDWWTSVRKAYCQAEVKLAALSFVTSVVPVSMALT